MDDQQRSALASFAAGLAGSADDTHRAAGRAIRLLLDEVDRLERDARLGQETVTLDPADWDDDIDPADTAPMRLRDRIRSGRGGD